MRILLALFTVLLSCGDNGYPTLAPEEPKILMQGSAAKSALLINELSARTAGESDWIEIHNRGQEALDLCQYFLTDSLDRLDHYYNLGGTLPPEPCDEALLPAGGYLIVWADDELAQGIGHAPFRLGEADELHLVDLSGLAIDSLIFLHPDTFKGMSLGRQPNAEGRFFFAPPSPMLANPSIEFDELQDELQKEGLQP